MQHKNFVCVVIVLLLLNGSAQAMKRSVDEIGELVGPPTKKQKNEPIVFKCSQCDDKFSSSASLDSHESHHTRKMNEAKIQKGKRLLNCPRDGCPFTARDKSKLEKHLDLHDNSNAVLCRIPGCGLLAVDEKGINHHITTMHKPQPVINWEYHQIFYLRPSIGSQSSRYLRYLLKSDRKLISDDERPQLVDTMAITDK